MAINLVEWLSNIKSPLERAVEGYVTETTLAGQKAQAAQAIGAKQIETSKMSNDLFNLAKKENLVPEDYVRMLTKYPDLAKHYKVAIDYLDEKQQSAVQKEALNVYSAIDTGQYDIAEKLLEEKIEAAKKTGDVKGQKSAEILLKTLKINPKLAQVAAGSFLAGALGKDEFAKALGELGGERRTEALHEYSMLKAGADLGLTRAQTMETLGGLDKTRAETQKILLELEQMRNNEGKVPVEKRFEAEQALRGEFFRHTSNYNLVQEAYRRIEVSHDTAAGDIALIFNFMKMLDPNSVVRESEYATVENARGVPDAFKILYNKALHGVRLGDTQRKNIKAQARDLMKAAQKRQKTLMGGYDRAIKNYGLNHENVFIEIPSEILDKYKATADKVATGKYLPKGEMPVFGKEGASTTETKKETSAIDEFDKYFKVK